MVLKGSRAYVLVVAAEVERGVDVKIECQFGVWLEWVGGGVCNVGRAESKTSRVKYSRGRQG